MISEPMGGAHVDYDQAAQNLKAALEKHLRELKKLSANQLLDQRYEKFRQIGEVAQMQTEVTETAGADEENPNE